MSVPIKHADMAVAAVTEFVGTAEMQFFKTNLHEMLIAFFLYHEAPDKEFKEDVIWSYTWLCALCDNLEKAIGEGADKC